MTDQIWKVLPGKNVDIYYLELEAQIVTKVQASKSLVFLIHIDLLEWVTGKVW